MTLAVDMQQAADSIALRSAGLDRLRVELARPDISDEALEMALAEALDSLGGDCLVDDFLMDAITAEFRRRVCTALCLPQPYAPMAMPEQALERPRLSAFERLRMVFRRLAS